MTKKEIKAAIADYGYKIIGPSWHRDKMAKSVLFNAYDDGGFCYTFFINYGTHYARRVMLTDTDVRLGSADVAFMFWEVA